MPIFFARSIANQLRARFIGTGVFSSRQILKGLETHLVDFKRKRNSLCQKKLASSCNYLRRETSVLYSNKTPLWDTAKRKKIFRMYVSYMIEYRWLQQTEERVFMSNSIGWNRYLLLISWFNHVCMSCCACWPRGLRSKSIRKVSERFVTIRQKPSLVTWSPIAPSPFFSAAMLVHGLRRAARAALRPNFVARTLRQTQQRTLPVCSQLCK